MEQLTEYEKKLKDSGLKITKGRIGIVKLLFFSEQPISADDIYMELKNQKVDINLSTVYRTLDALAEKGIVTKISLMSDDRSLFEYNQLGHRHYLVCMNCRKIITVMHCPLGDYESKLEKETNFHIMGHKLYLYGYCEECRKKLNLQ